MDRRRKKKKFLQREACRLVKALAVGEQHD
jgi:hypothetical protein